LFLKRWICEEKPHWVLDAAFGSDKLLTDIAKWGGTATMSMAVSNLPWLWNVLSRNTLTNTWRAAVNSGGWVVSSHTVLDKQGKRSYQQLLSNGFQAERLEMAANVGTLAVDTSQQTNRMPVFEETALNRLTVEELRGICRKWNVKTGKKKAGYVTNIVERSNTLNHNFGQLQALQSTLETQWNPDPAPMHDFYRAHFGAIDSVNRKWNAVEEHHQNQHWESKMMLVILRFTTLNSWVYATKSNYKKWRHWHEGLGQELLTYTGEFAGRYEALQTALVTLRNVSYTS
jgi:hypothetical protein